MIKAEEIYASKYQHHRMIPDGASTHQYTFKWSNYYSNYKNHFEVNEDWWLVLQYIEVLIVSENVIFDADFV